MAHEVYSRVDRCGSCAYNQNRFHHKRTLQPFSQFETLDFVAMDILGPLLKNTSANQHVVAATDRYSKLIWNVSSSKTTSSRIANFFLDQLITPYGITFSFHTTAQHLFPNSSQHYVDTLVSSTLRYWCTTRRLVVNPNDSTERW